MANNISLGPSNDGVQVGINHGHISVHEAATTQTHIRTQGGAIFDGTFSANRDIYINHFTEAPRLARDLYQSKILLPVQHELALLILALEAATDQNSAFTTNGTEFCTIRDALEECYNVLEGLTVLQKRFDDIGPEMKSALRKMDLDEKELMEVGMRLGAWTCKLKRLDTRIDQSFQKDFGGALERFIEQLRTGERDRTTVLQALGDPLSANERIEWSKLRNEFESIGLTARIFDLNRDFIVFNLQRRLQGFHKMEPSCADVMTQSQCERCTLKHWLDERVDLPSHISVKRTVLNGTKAHPSSPGSSSSRLSAKDTGRVRLRETSGLHEESNQIISTAQILALSGKHSQAEMLLLGAIENSTKIHGPNDVETLYPMFCLGKVLSFQKRYSEAEKLFYEVVKQMDFAGAHQNTNTLHSVQCLGEALYHQGRFRAAQSYFKRTTKERHIIFGPEHADTLFSTHWLGEVLLCRGLYSKAAAVFHHALTGRQTTVGCEHIDTILSEHRFLYCQGQHHFETTNFEEARVSFQEAKDKAKSKFGPNNTDTHVSSLDWEVFL
ncbi:choline/ethanolamine kinase [Penicillium atrosanguineum]|uniref:choline/ethanolamine kinase n=1 Tax=Penicillium atrosanguineum TaxID=1132637 RepID=UPI00239139B5|nr:choline/ethanolamine kinase [Penicillium atrosanguineum]KAJ5298832.1 choline/ethanolamine kinase [Penicillium atrosanguineum]